MATKGIAVAIRAGAADRALPLGASNDPPPPASAASVRCIHVLSLSPSLSCVSPPLCRVSPPGECVRALACLAAEAVARNTGCSPVRWSVRRSVGRSLPRLSLAQTDLCKWEMEPLPPQPPTAAMMMMICSPCVVLGSRWPPSAEAASCGRKAVALELLQWRDLQTDGRRQSVCACACVGDLGLEALSSERPSNIFCPSSHRGRIPRGKGN